MEGGNEGARRRRSFHKLLRSNARTASLYLVIGTGAAAVALHYSKSDVLPSTSQNIIAGIDGAVRSARALYNIGFVVVDYKYSLRGLDPNSGLSKYRNKLAEVHLRSARRMLKLCEMNQGFYVKAGQFVSSMRQVPKEYSSVLSSLQDRAAPYKFKDIKQVLTENLRKEMSQIFLSFEEEPIAAASIAQVHRAILRDNKEVAVKVQYPGLVQRMKIDITSMSILSKLVSWIFPDYRFERLVSEFERAISLELDFVQEAKNSERTARNFKGNNIPLKFLRSFGS